MIPKESPEEISLGGGLTVAGLLKILSNNDNIITSGISNCIPSPSNLRYVMKKARKATFMRIAVFLFNYTCSMSCDKGERAGLVRLFKDIYLWDVELVQ